MPQPLTRREVSILSPLRYPGAKRRLSGYVAEALRLNALRPTTIVEPFAGGASVTLQLLNDGLVGTAVLGERDPLVASFWKVAFHDSDWLIAALADVKVTLDQWDAFKTNPGRTDRDRAIACVFLNRTSFSGILAKGAGPIGGRTQASPYGLDCRFNVTTLTKRIRQVAALAPRVLLVNYGDWTDTLDKAKRFRVPKDEMFYYFDPPFYAKAERLYRFYFASREHGSLHDAIMRLHSPWLLSYDAARPIVELYSHNGRGPRHVDLLYSLKGSSKPAMAREVIVSNLARLPTRTRLWRSSAEWNLPVIRNALEKRGERNGHTTNAR
jgi:DNA adenine methylase